jgi:uncharacterized membrane protein YccC
MERLFGIIVILAIVFAVLTYCGVPPHQMGPWLALAFIVLVFFSTQMYRLIRHATVGVAVLVLLMYLTGVSAFIPFGVCLLVVLGIADLLLTTLVPRGWRRRRRRSGYL